MRNKITAALVAGGLLVGAGFVTSVVSSPGTASAQEATDSAGDERGSRLWGFLEEVLADLVGEGTIDQGQADAIVEAAEAKAEEIKAEREAVRELFGDLTEDGVLTEEEASQLPEDHWVFNDSYDEAWENGELTTDEIRENRPHQGKFRKAARLGALLDDGGIDQEEYDSLSDDHPLKQVDVSEYLSDGVITIEELREIREANKDTTDA